MTLHISEIEFYQFRNYPQLSLRDIGDVTIFVGENAIGKTNILEGISLATTCMSFRHPTTDQLIFHSADEKQSRIAVQLQGDSRELSVEMVVESGKRSFRINGKNKKSADIRGLAPAVVFTPDDLMLVKSGNAVRRDALDDLGSQLSENHAKVRQDVSKILSYKNRLLKDGASADMVASINELLVTCGAQLTWYREALFARFMPKVCEHYASLSTGKEQLTGEYIPSWVEHGQISEQNFPASGEGNSRDHARELTRQALENRFQDEIIRQRAFIGPHMDKVTLYLDGKPANDFASQGQQRSIVLAWKLAEVDLMKEMLQVSPILLLDDVMSELDERRRNALESCIAEGMQTFITTTNLSYFTEAALQKAKVIHLPLQ